MAKFANRQTVSGWAVSQSVVMVTVLSSPLRRVHLNHHQVHHHHHHLKQCFELLSFARPTFGRGHLTAVLLSPHSANEREDELDVAMSSTAAAADEF